MTEKPTAFHDLPADAFPVVVEYQNRDGIVIRTDTIDGPGVYEVPALVPLYGPIWSRVTTGDGTEIRIGPHGEAW